jgi:radical SAM superfamily enzyme YgiQ (UPF0313 family)
MVITNWKQNPLFPQFTEEFGFNGESEWGKASLRVLFFFPSLASDKLHSRTPFTLYNILKAKFGPSVFVDICMEPSEFQMKAYFREYPVIVGAFSHRTWHDFDILGLSVAIARSEFAEAYRSLHQDGFPLSHGDRLDDGRTPLLVLGGIAADGSGALDGVVDLVLLGLGERVLPALVEAAFQAQAARGSVSRGKRQVIEAMKRFRGVCYPQDYPYGWHVRDGVVHSFPVWKEELSRIEPDTLLDIEEYGAAGDVQRAWAVSGSRRASVLVSWGCSGAGSCTFCAEGNLYGPWRERSFPAMIRAFREAKHSLMGETLSLQSFNSSYYSRFPELLAEAYRYFDLVSVLNFRLDELAASIRGGGKNNYLTLMREFGSVVVAGAVEGFGDRVRNQLYNKNLTFEDILLVAEEVFRNKFMKFKTGYILSGHETKEEMDEGIEEIRAIAELKKRMAGATQYVVSVTKLVHYFGTPVYQLPRVTSYLNWLETFGHEKAYYPFFGLPGDLVSVKSTSGIGDTFIQQLHQDLPAELGEAILLRPALRHRVMSRGYLDEVKRRLEGYGVKPREQFLDFNPSYNPRQHYLLSHSQGLFERDPVFKARAPCLRTLSTSRKSLVCHGCGACTEMSFDKFEMKSSFREKLLGRDLVADFGIEKIRAVRMLNSPSFFYTLIFTVNDAGRFVSKDCLVRAWFRELASRDEDFALNFRRFSYSFSAHMEYGGMVSNYCGYEAVVAGFRKRLGLILLEEMGKNANLACPTIQFVHAVEIFEKPTVPGFWALFELRVMVSWRDMGAVLGCFLEHPFRRYTGSTTKYQEVTFPFYYKVMKTKDGPLLYLCLPGKVNPSYSLMEMWHYNKFNKMLSSQTIRAVLSPAGDHTFVDVVTGKVRSMRGFQFVGGVEDMGPQVAEVGEVQGA